jgi:hypothetical protein
MLPICIVYKLRFSSHSSLTWSVRFGGIFFICIYLLEVLQIMLWMWLFPLRKKPDLNCVLPFRVCGWPCTPYVGFHEWIIYFFCLAYVFYAFSSNQDYFRVVKKFWEGTKFLFFSKIGMEVYRAFVSFTNIRKTYLAQNPFIFSSQAAES